MWKKLQHIILISIIVCNVVSTSVVYAVTPPSDGNTTQENASLEPFTDSTKETSSEENEQITSTPSKDMSDETESTEPSGTNKPSESAIDESEATTEETIQQEKEPEVEKVPTEKIEPKEKEESLTPEEQGYEFIANPQKMSVATTQIENLHELVTIKKDGILVSEDDYILTLVEPFKKLNYYNEVSYVKLNVHLNNKDIEKEVSVPITVTSGETIVLTGMESYDMGLTLLNEGGKTWLRSSNFKKNNGEKLHSELENQGVSEYYRLKIYNKDERPYSVIRKTSDKAGSFVQSFEDQIIEENTVVQVQYTEKESTNRLLYFSNGDEPEQTKHSSYYKIVDGKFRTIAPLLEFEMPTKLKYTKEGMSNQEIEKLVKDNISMKTGDLKELSFNYKKYPDISLAQDTASVEVKWEISPGYILTDEFEVDFYKYDLIPQNQKVSVGTVKLTNTNLEDFVKIQTPTTTLSKDQYTVKLIDNVTIETFTHYGNTSIQVEVTVKEDGFKQEVTVPFTVLKGETLELLGKPGTPQNVDGGLSLIQEDEGLMLRASDFSTDGNGSKLDDRYGTDNYHLIKIYKPDGTLQYELSRKGNDIVGELYKKFEPQNVEEGTIISLKEGNQDKITYWHNETQISKKSPVAGRDTDYYIVQNNTLKKVTSTVPTIKEVPEEIVYPKPNMTDTEIKDLIESKITVQAGSVKDLNLTYLKIPDTSKQEEDDTAILEIKTEISPGNFISDEYTIRFTFYDIKTLSKEIPVTTRKVKNIESQIEVETGRGSPEFSVSVEGSIDPYYFNQINTTKNLDVRVHVENTGYERVVQVPFKIIAGQSMSFTGANYRTDIGLSLIEEDSKLFLRASDFTDNSNNAIHSGVGNNPHYRVNVHDADGFINYEWLRKGSDKIQDGYKKFGGDEKQIEVKEGTVISMWRTEWHTLNYWDNSSTSVRHEWIDGREKQEFYVVENNKFRRVMNVLPAYTVPEKAEYPKLNMSHKEIERFVKKQIIMKNGQVENLTLNMTKYPDTSDITKDDTAEFDISFEIEPGKTVSYKHKMLFQYFTISTEEKNVPVGTQFDQITDLNSLVSVTKDDKEQPFEMRVLDKPDQYYFNTYGSTNNLRIEVSLQNGKYIRETTIPLKIIAGQTFEMQGNSYWVDMGFSLLKENNELVIRASDFKNSNNDGMLHRVLTDTYYEMTFYDSFLADDPFYTFSRKGSDIIQDGYKKFEPQKVDENTIIGLYRVQAHSINYWDNSSNSVRHSFISGRKTDYYRIENKRFVRMTMPQSPTLNDVTTLSNKVIGQAEPNTKIYIRVDGLEIATGVTDQSGKFEISIPRQKAGIKIAAQAENKVGRSQLVDTIVIQDVPAKPTVNPVFDNDKKVTGMGDAGEQITVAMGNKVLGRGTIKENGEFDLPIEEQLAGIKLTIYASNSKGSSEIEEVVVQLTAPDKPEVVEFTDRDTKIIGTGKPGSEVEVTIGPQVYTGTVNRKKEFSIPVPTQEAGTEFSVKLKNKAGESPTAISKVLLTEPDAPIVLPVESEGISVKGQAKKGSTVEVYSGDKLIGESKTSKEGSFDIVISPQRYGTELKVSARNAAGESDPTLVIVGLVPPIAPFVNEITDNDSKVTGKGTPGAEVLIYREETLIGQGNVGVDGTFSVSIPVQRLGTTLNIYLKNTIGMSQPTEQKVILGKPLEMSVNEITDLDDSISGTGKENATVQVFKNKKVIAEGKASDDGSFTLEIPIQKAGTILKLQQQNEAGKGPVAEAIVLLTAPKKPKVNQVTDRDTTLTGQGKAQTETIVTNMDGKVIGKDTSDEKGEFTISIPIQKAYTILLVTQENAKGVSLPATIMVAHVSSGSNTNISGGISSLTNTMRSFIEGINSSQTTTILDKSIENNALKLAPPKNEEEEFIDLEQIEEDAQHIANKLPKENSIPGKKENQEGENDYLIPMTLSAGVSLAAMCIFLIYKVYIDKRYRDRHLFKETD
ncbi:Ig-like domain-containing protein [Listeria monocytogenes]|uniref:Ig-like domain-containing protein n=1 Tax=Listeria monocytogenes TaxID=1639 RepID=UPI0012490477|nr:Ig-like domain-containing protein [Listeria monocytogenes]QEZ71681.1 hypothetical protein D7405_04345 [Listeria monocytogenes]